MNEDIYTNDIENRFPTFTLTKTVNQGLTTAQLLDGPTLIAQATGGNSAAAVFKLRFNVVGDNDILPLQTTAQRDSLTLVEEGQHIIVTDAVPSGIHQIQFYDGTSWVNVPVNIWNTIAGDSGSSTPDIPLDTLTIVGGTNVSTTIVGDTLTIDATGGGGNAFGVIVGDTGTANADSSSDTVSIVGTTDEIVTVANDSPDSVVIGIADDPVLPGTGSVTVPTGTTAQQPSGVVGMIRYNTTLSCLESFIDGDWQCLAYVGPGGGGLEVITNFSNLPASPTVDDLIFYAPFNSIMTYDSTDWVGPKTTVVLFGKGASANQSAWMDCIGGAQAHPDGTTSHGYFVPNITDGGATNSGWKIYHISAENDTNITADIEIHSNATTSGTPTFGTTGLIRVQLVSANAGETELATPVTVDGGDIIQGFFRKITGNARDITTTVTYSLFARA